MATKKAHCLGDVDAIHIPCGGQGGGWGVSKSPMLWINNPINIPF